MSIVAKARRERRKRDLREIAQLGDRGRRTGVVIKRDLRQDTEDMDDVDDFFASVMDSKYVDGDSLDEISVLRGATARASGRPRHNRGDGIRQLGQEYDDQYLLTPIGGEAYGASSIPSTPNSIRGMKFKSFDLLGDEGSILEDPIYMANRPQKRNMRDVNDLAMMSPYQGGNEDLYSPGHRAVKKLPKHMRGPSKLQKAKVSLPPAHMANGKQAVHFKRSGVPRTFKHPQRLQPRGVPRFQGLPITSRAFYPKVRGTSRQAQFLKKAERKPRVNPKVAEIRSYMNML